MGPTLPASHTWKDRLCIRIAMAMALPCLVQLCTATSGLAGPTGFSHDNAAKSLLASAGLGDLPANEISLERLLEKAHVNIQLGLYDVRYPLDLLRKQKQGKCLKDVALCLLQVQNNWMMWVDPGDSSSSSRRSRKTSAIDSDLAILIDWVESWKASQLSRLAQGQDESNNLLDRLAADEEVVAASRKLHQRMCRGVVPELPSRRGKPDSIQFVLAPSRESFLGLASFVGSLGERQKKLLWVDSLPAWTEFHWDNLLVLALEYAAPDWQLGAYCEGLSMKTREKTGMLQHVAQHATESLARYYYGKRLDPAFQAGIEVKAVIDLFKENNARAGGSEKGASTAARSKFVPGYTSGGRLPPINADSRWRHGKGRDYFIGVLRKGQQEGKKLAAKNRLVQRNPIAHFALNASDDSDSQWVVTAPFIGSTVGEKTIPDAWASDYREFFRAYVTAFVYWMQHHSDKGHEFAANRALADLLRECASRQESSFEDVVSRVYGVPLSGLDPATESLEWQFLNWLSRH